MKKIININFHSRVVPIEETAYEILQQYIESLRRYFANEEGRDEIISDIENRFAELFSETLKKGATCITDADVNAIIVSMGRPEDFGDDEVNSGAAAAGASASGAGQGAGSQADYQYSTEETRRLYRADNDKILGGVCAGLANFLRLDPAIVRILFVLITFGWGAGVLIYIILWMVLPTKSLPANVRKRLYRNPDDRVIGGIGSGLAAYFHIDVWIPRLIFATPLILSILTSIFRHAWWFEWDGPAFVTGGFGGTLFITYIVLWIVLPEAVTASEKLEMRGEKVDLESIKNTIKSDLGNLNKRAKEMGSEVKDSFQKVGDQVRQSSQGFTAEAGPILRKTGTGFGHAIGVLFKAFFLFIAGIIAFALIMVLVAIAFRGEGFIDLKNYILTGFTQNLLAWISLLLFLVIPVVALLTWLIRRITGVRSRNHYLGYTFGTLWVIGLFCTIALIGTVMSNFRSRQHAEENIILAQPAHGRLIIRTMEGQASYSDGGWWFDDDGEHFPFHNLNDDSLLINTVRVNLVASKDSAYHVQLIKLSHGNTGQTARQLAQQIVFPVQQKDSVLLLPYGFPVTTQQKWRNQQVLVNVAVPVGKKVVVAGNVENYNWFSINPNNRHFRWNKRHNDWDRDWDNDSEWEMNGKGWTSDVEYIMTGNGLVRTDKKGSATDSDKNSDDDDDDNDDRKKPTPPVSAPAPPVSAPPASAPGNTPAKPGGEYRYKRPQPAATPDTTEHIRSTASRQGRSDSHIYFLSALFL